MKLSTLKALYTDTLIGLYTRSEAENIFYIVIDGVEKKSKTDVIVGYDTMLDSTYIDILAELKSGKPIQYIIQCAPFYTLEVYVNESVLIPRPETEELVHLVIQEHSDFKGSILDIGTGSGCIALALKKFLPHAAVTGLDISEKALEVAKENSIRLSLDINFQSGNILEFQQLEDVDIIVSNPPYIARSERTKMHKNVLDYEPEVALFVEDTDPLLFYKRIINLAEKNTSLCYFETSEFYREQLDDWMDSKQLSYRWYSDFQGKDRMLKVSF